MKGRQKVKPPPAVPQLVDQTELVKNVLAARGKPDNPKNRRAALDVAAVHQLAKIQEDIEAAAAEVVLDVLKFAEAQGMDEPSQEMVETHGQAIAEKRFRQMQAGLLPTKDSPVGVRVAMNIHAAAMRAKSDAASPKLNAQVAILQVTPAQYPVLKVDR